MKVIRAKSAGFCWGVERAIDIAQACAGKENKQVFTDGPLIHNTQMMNKLKDEGINELGDYQSSVDLDISEKEKADSVLVVRAHGISPERRKYLKSLNIKFKDGTCPDVGIIAGKIKLYANKGYNTVIFGDPKHPEVIGLKGYTAEDKGYVIESIEDLEALPKLEGGVCMVSQSTMFTYEFNDLSERLKQKYPDLMVFDTICGATKERQGDLKFLIDEGAEAIIVIGGHHSANTKKLTKLAMLHDKPTFHIELADEINAEEMEKFETVGVTAGASTPDFIIDSVCNRLNEL
jgi:(E)-4-hydroxy-3-methyl-but-2-enyl pyrophosphate reductase